MAKREGNMERLENQKDSDERLDEALKFLHENTIIEVEVIDGLYKLTIHNGEYSLPQLLKPYNAEDLVKLVDGLMIGHDVLVQHFGL